MSEIPFGPGDDYEERLARALGADLGRLGGAAYEELIRETLQDAVAFRQMERAQLEDYHRLVEEREDE